MTATLMSFCCGIQALFNNLSRGEHDVGMSRLALSDEDRHVRDWFVETTKSLGCDVNCDEMVGSSSLQPAERH